jgi:ribosomal protein L24
MAAFKEGDPVKVIGGKYKGLSAVIVKPTEKMYYIRLLDHNEVVRVLARNLVKVDAKKEVIALIVDELQEIRKRMEALELLLRDLRLDV